MGERVILMLKDSVLYVKVNGNTVGSIKLS